jgi:nickel/cobalt exporter
MSPDVAASSETAALCLTALSIGGIHTLLGPDHYVPFVAMSRAAGWSSAKTIQVTVACGLGHVAGSVAIGLVGLALGIVALKLEWLEAVRGDLAAWMLIAFGLVYLAWGVVQAVWGIQHPHPHVAAASTPWAPWLLFLLFVFGPCEPLIPLLLYPAAKANGWAVAAVVGAFAAATLATMTAAVLAMRYGVGMVRLPALAPFGHAFAGLAVLVCGVLVKFGL